MLVEILVLGRQERIDDELGNGLDRQIQPAFLGIFAEQRAIGRMNPRHDRGLVILKLRIVRQVLGKMPDHPCHGGHAHQEHDGSGGEQETQEPHQQAHYRISVPALAPQPAALSSGSEVRYGTTYRPEPGASYVGREANLINSEDLAVVFL